MCALSTSEQTKFPSQKLCQTNKWSSVHSTITSNSNFFRMNHFAPFAILSFISVEFANKLALKTIHWQNWPSLAKGLSHLNYDVTWNLLTTLFATNGCSIVHLWLEPIPFYSKTNWKLFNLVEAPRRKRERERESTKHSYFTWNISVAFRLNCDVDDFIFFYYYYRWTRRNKKKKFKFIILIDSNNR